MDLKKITPDAIYYALEGQKAALEVPIGLDTVGKDKLKQLVQYLFVFHWGAYFDEDPNGVWEFGTGKYSAIGKMVELKDFYQVVLDQFESILQKEYDRSTDEQRYGILLRLNKSMYHTYQMNFESAKRPSIFTFEGAPVEPSRTDFKFKSLFDEAATSFRNNLY